MAWDKRAVVKFREVINFTAFKDSHRPWLTLNAYHTECSKVLPSIRKPHTSWPDDERKDESLQQRQRCKAAALAADDLPAAAAAAACSWRLALGREKGRGGMAGGGRTSTRQAYYTLSSIHLIINTPCWLQLLMIRTSMLTSQYMLCVQHTRRTASHTFPSRMTAAKMSPAWWYSHQGYFQRNCCPTYVRA